MSDIQRNIEEIRRRVKMQILSEISEIYDYLYMSIYQQPLTNHSWPTTVRNKPYLSNLSETLKRRVSNIPMKNITEQVTHHLTIS